MFLYSNPGRKLGTESLKQQQQQEKPRLPGFGGKEGTSRGWRRQRIRKRGGSKAECVLGEGASERADQAGWSSRREPNEEVLARFTYVESLESYYKGSTILPACAHGWWRNLPPGLTRGRHFACKCTCWTKLPNSRSMRARPWPG